MISEYAEALLLAGDIIKLMKENIKVQTKICAVCKKPFNNRKKWASRGQWEQIKYCSEKCRNSKKS